MRTDLVEWSHADPRQWSYKVSTRDADSVVFALDRVRDFSEPEFRTLGELLAQRVHGLAERQVVMLEQLHELGLRANCTIALRLCKHVDSLKLYVVVRVAHQDTREALAAQVQAILLPAFYSFERIEETEDPQAWHEAMQPDWATHILELLKPQTRVDGILRPFYLYTPRWQAKAEHDLRLVCEALLRQKHRVMIDMSLMPTRFSEAEQKWLADTIADIEHESRGGELLDCHTGRRGRYVSRPDLADKSSSLGSSLGAYTQRPLFLHAIRILSDDAGTAQHIATTLATQSARLVPTYVLRSASDEEFGLALRRVESVAIAPEVQPSSDTPQSVLGTGSGQRFPRLATSDEIAGFWRLPISLAATFPGFALDAGRKERQMGLRVLRLGTIADNRAITSEAFAIDREALARHALIVGMPGSGKTTVIQHLLYQLWHTTEPRDAIPFLVLEPAKTEYRALKRLERFRDDMLIFTLGDERISPFRFNPFAVPVGVPVESHIAKLNACFVGAFNLFDPLPILLDKSIRLMYEEKGWYDETVGGEPGVETPTLSDLYGCARRVIEFSGYSDKLRDDFTAALLQRLDSLRRGSKGRMLDTRESVPIADLLNRPVVVELDALNDDEKALLMMFMLTMVYEVARVQRRSGSPLRHVLVAEEAHNLIGRSSSGGSEQRANPKEQAIRLFTRMLAEMRALGEGIVIADQLPTAIASEAVKQTNVKILLRLTALDDRKEVGNTMNLDEQQLLEVARLGRGDAYVALDDLPKSQKVTTDSFKEQHQVEEPPDDVALAEAMRSYHETRPLLYMPYVECRFGCTFCDRRVRSQAERLVRTLVDTAKARTFIKNNIFWDDRYDGLERALDTVTRRESDSIRERYHELGAAFSFCVRVHFLYQGKEIVADIDDLPPNFPLAFLTS